MLVVVAALALTACASGGSSSTASEQQVAADGDEVAGATGAPSAQADPTAVPQAADTTDVSDESESGDSESDESADAEAEADPQVDEFLASFEHYRWQRVAELGHFPIGDIETIFGDDVFPQQLASGEYETGVLGTEVTFRLGEPLILAREFPGMLSFVDVNLAGTIHIARPSAIFTAEGAVSDENFFNYRTGIAPVPENIEAWLRSIGQIEVGDAQETTISGQPATRYELTSKPDDFYFCRRGTCLRLFHVGPDKIELFGHQRSVLWHVPHTGGDVVIVAKADPENYEAWLSITEQVVESLSLGAPMPSPLTSDQYWAGWGTVGPGEWSLPGLPWTFDFDLREVTLNHKDGYLSVSPPAERRGLLLARFVETREGLTATLETIDKTLGEKYDRLDVVERDSMVVLGHEARVFDVGSKPGDLEFKHAPDAPGVDVLGTDNFALVPTPARIWAWEHDGDLWLYAVGAANEDEYEMTLAWGQRVLEGGRLGGEATALGAPSALVEPGSYETEALGFPLAIQTNDPWTVEANANGVVSLSGDDDATGDRGVVFSLASNLDGDLQDGGFDGWLTSVENSLDVGEVTTALIGDRSALVVDVSVSADATCAVDDAACVLLFTSGDDKWWLASDSMYRFVWFEDDTSLVAVASAPVGDDDTLATSFAVITTATIDT